MSGLADFDRWCEQNSISPDETPSAFAAWLHRQTGWDGPMVCVHGKRRKHSFHDFAGDRFPDWCNGPEESR
jgi:hypothetical protein